MYARTLLSLSLLVLASSATALPRVHFLLSDETPPYHELVDAAGEMIDGHAAHTSGPIAAGIPEDAGIVVTVGTAAARWVVEWDEDRVVISALIPALSWAAITAGAPGAAHRRSALYLDQPLERQVAFVRTLLPPARDLGAMFGPSSRALEGELGDAAERHGFRLYGAHVNDAGTPADAAAGLFRSAEVLLALPDPQVFNRYTVQSILLVGFRQRRPVVGFSASWVRAGALGALYSTPAQIGEELGEWLVDIASGMDAGPPRWPRDYAFSVNRQVAFSLGITVPSDAVLQRRLTELEPAE